MQPIEINVQDDWVDYHRWLIECGLSDTFVRAIVEDMTDHADMPSHYDAAELRGSSIHGMGMFATRCIPGGALIAPARLLGKRTHAGRFINHSTRPNAKFIRVNPAVSDGDLYAIASRDIAIGEEILLDYRQVGSINGLGISPDKTEAITTVQQRLHRSGFDAVAPADLEQFLTGVLIAKGYLPSDLVSLICGCDIARMAELVGYLRAGLYVAANARLRGESDVNPR